MVKLQDKNASGRIHVKYINTALIAISILSSSCGGGGGGSTGSAAGGGNTGNTITGVAATGLAIAGGTVTLKCTGDSLNSTTTANDGSYSIDASQLKLPCLGQIAYVDESNKSRKLHTPIISKGIANITPITDLIVASMTDSLPTIAFDTFTTANSGVYTLSNIRAGELAVLNYMENSLGVQGTDLELIKNMITSQFSAKSSTSNGDRIDAILEDLKAKLSAKSLDMASALDDISNGAGSPLPASGTSTPLLQVSNGSNPRNDTTYTWHADGLSQFRTFLSTSPPCTEQLCVQDMLPIPDQRGSLASCLQSSIGKIRRTFNIIKNHSTGQNEAVQIEKKGIIQLLYGCSEPALISIYDAENREWVGVGVTGDQPPPPYMDAYLEIDTPSGYEWKRPISIAVCPLTEKAFLKDFSLNYTWCL